MEVSPAPMTLTAMEMPLTEPLRRRHVELRAGVDRLLETAASLRRLDPEDRGASVARALDFLRGELQLHAEAEEMWLYPAVARRLGHPAATQAMALDHRLLREQVDALAAADIEDVPTLERLLYGIHALLDAHFRKEEDAYLPLLEYEDLTDAVAAVDVGMRQHEHGLDVGVTEDVIDLNTPKFPESRSDGAKLAYLVRYAVRAPSNHNSQPWRFRLAGDTLSLFADRTRALPVVDSDDRELLMSCGAALLHLRVAARHFGHALDIDLLPDPADHDLLARIELHEAARPTYEEKLLFWATSHRRTNRNAFEPRPLPDGFAETLARTAEEEGAWLSLVDGEAERLMLAELVSEGDRRQLHDPSFRRELAAWVHPTRKRAKDGMPSYALRVPALLSKLGPVALRTFDVGKGVAARDRKLLDASPALFVLGTAGDDEIDRVRGGMALAHVLLRATQDELSASFLNQPVELPDLRPRVTELAGRTGWAQAILRIGYGPDVQATPRRTLTDVVEIS
jgi:iron-sulfur cluster repair protein YtfE (RIC family)